MADRPRALLTNIEQSSHQAVLHLVFAADPDLVPDQSIPRVALGWSHGRWPESAAASRLHLNGQEISLLERIMHRGMTTTRGASKPPPGIPS